VNDLEDYPDVVARIRNGLRDVSLEQVRPEQTRTDAPETRSKPAGPLEVDRLGERKSIRGPMVAVGAAVAVLVSGAVSIAFLSSRPDHGSETVATAPTDGGTNTMAPEVLIEWTRTDLPEGFEVHKITVAGGQFFGLAVDELSHDAEGVESDAHTRLWLSDDGADWEAIDVDATRFGMRAAYFQEIDTIGDTLIGLVKGQPLTEQELDVRLVVSEDAHTWAPADFGGATVIPVAIAGGDAGGIALALAQGGGYDTYDVWHSADGTTWRLTASETFSGVSGPVVEIIEGRLYVGAREWVSSDQTPSLWTSTNASDWTRIRLPSLGADWAGWAVPSGSPGGLAVSTGGRSAPEVWLMSNDGTWADVTPVGYSGGTVIGSSGGGPALVIEPGRSDAPEDLSRFVPATIWWSLDGTGWLRLSASDAFGSEGTIEAAASLGDRIVVIYYTHPERVGSIWIGRIAE